MGRLFLLLFLIHLALAFAAIVDCLGGEQRPERWSRAVWSLLIVFGVLAGPVAWFTRGRPGRKFGASWSLPGLPGPAPGSPRPMAPDDDPDFLAGLEPTRGTDGAGPTKPTAGGPPPAPPDTAGRTEETTPETTPDERNNGTG